ncbi:hypothetical protein CR159_18710 [Pollutimonas subterranea]|uniref:DUF421 domain-containing protein n=1 Tax=Pollutimonas subterranea TaxID=2045210 RepID=A0A2N4TZY3_9BURK|nr:DUF421 domain-containing protein [Pollutimonas subterranea]PLC48324.1 hypothetical protein CR159_18710 [Pollutimonas subterranea]
MNAFDWHRMFLDKLPLVFLAEVALRVFIAYLLVFLFLKVSGRRGIRQLSVFELVVILTLGSAAGDVTFYDDVPIAPVATVFVVLLLLYRTTTYLMTRSSRLAAWMDGSPVTLIRDGRYEIDNLTRLNISEDEFFMELRQQGVEHLGQVRMGILEIDGDVSLFFYDDDLVQPGLSVLPPEHRQDHCHAPADGLYACNNCGHTQSLNAHQESACSRCSHSLWSVALANRRAR